VALFILTFPLQRGDRHFCINTGKRPAKLFLCLLFKLTEIAQVRGAIAAVFVQKIFGKNRVAD